MEAPLAHTTPEPITLHRVLAEAEAAGVTHAAMEASSHGLEQRRLDGVRLAAAAFTNFSQDHLDYHESFEEYFDAKAGFSPRAARGWRGRDQHRRPGAGPTWPRSRRARAGVLTVGHGRRAATCSSGAAVRAHGAGPAL